MCIVVLCVSVHNQYIPQYTDDEADTDEEKDDQFDDRGVEIFTRKVPKMPLKHSIEIETKEADGEDSDDEYEGTYTYGV